MKVRLLSDLHLEFGDFHPGFGDVLVLSGDICVVKEYRKYHKFFKQCAEGYNKVFYTLGNHEYYDSDWNEVDRQLRAQLPEGITLLNNQSEYYKGWHFVGAPLWASFAGANEAVMETCQTRMSDYNIIDNGNKLLTPTDTLMEHMDTVEWLGKCIPNLIGPVFMLTHHAPSMQSVGDEYRTADIKGAYASDLERFITQNPNIRIWTHGHIHETRDYMVGTCNVMSNPRGYDGYELNVNFNPDMEIDLYKHAL